MNHPYYTPADLPPEPPAEPTPPDGAGPDDVKQHFSRLGLAYLILTVGVGTASYATTLAVRALCPSLLTSWWFIWFLSLVPLYAVALPLLWLCLRRIPTSPHDPRKTMDGVTVDNPPFGAPRWFSLLIISFGCMVVGSLAGNYVMSLLSAVTGHDYASSLSVAIDTTPPWFTLLCTCILGPLGEELLYRKLLIDRTRRFGDKTSILLSGILFGLFHFNLFQFFYATMVGVILAYVYTRTGKYLLCVAMHAVYNLVGSVMIPALSRLMAPLTDPALPEELLSGSFALADLTDLIPAFLAMMVLLIWQYGSLIVAIILLVRNFRRTALAAGEIPTADRPELPWLNPGMIACILVMLAILVSNLIPPL